MKTGDRMETREEDTYISKSDNWRITVTQEEKSDAKSGFQATVMSLLQNELKEASQGWIWILKVN